MIHLLKLIFRVIITLTILNIIGWAELVLAFIMWDKEYATGFEKYFGKLWNINTKD